VCGGVEHAYSADYIADTGYCRAKDAVHEDRVVVAARHLFAHARLRASIADLGGIIDTISGSASS
jgi:hypothetical protein